MILSNQDIQHMSSGTSPLVTPFATGNLRLSSYDLTIGDEYYNGKIGRFGKIETQKLQPSQSFTIPPHGVCFILSEEVITLPHDITAKVSLRMSLLYRGLVLTSQPPFDPGYSGKVIVMIHNLSSDAYHLQRGSRIATIEFNRVGNPTPASSTGPQTHRSVVNLIGQLTAPVKSSLIEISSAASRANEKVNFLMAQMLVFAALIVAILAVPGWFSYKYFDDRQGDQSKRIDALQKTVEEQALTLVELRKQISMTCLKKDIVTCTEAAQEPNQEKKGGG